MGPSRQSASAFRNGPFGVKAPSDNLAAGIRLAVVAATWCGEMEAESPSQRRGGSCEAHTQYCGFIGFIGFALPATGERTGKNSVLPVFPSGHLLLAEVEVGSPICGAE